MVVASAVGSFFLFLLIGLGALAFTAALDRVMGKERALLLYAVAIAALVFLTAPSPETVGNAQARRLSVDLPSGAEQVDPFAHAPSNPALERNIFEKYSDTRPLPPITLEQPPWVALPFPVPPTIPGPAPSHRRSLRSEVPALSAGDGSSIADMAEDSFTEYKAAPKDVYDWILDTAGRPIYIYIRAIRPPGGDWVFERQDGFDELKWTLYRQREGWEDLTVKYAYIGPESQAAKFVDPIEVLNKSQENLSDKPASEAKQVFLRESVDNLYRKAIEKHGMRIALENPTLSGLRQAAAEMAEVGRTGKESKAGWRRAVTLLERALELAKSATAQTRAGILDELREAYVALRDEAATLRVLAEYAEASGDDHRPWHWLGEFMLEIGLPEAALRYQQEALEKTRNDPGALLGAGRALAYTGDHAAALDRFQSSRADGSKLRTAEALLRLGRLAEAKSEVDRVVGSDPSPAALLVRGAILYTQGQLEDARKDFATVAADPSATAERARAAYNLGLTCFRLGQHDAAQAAFDACRKALEYGSSPGPFADETVSPSLGEALLALGAGEADKVPAAIERARREAPGSAYLEMLAGVVAARQGNTASAARAFEAAQRLAVEYGELDGWLAITYLRLAEQQVSTGADADTVTETFARALAFAERAAASERKADPSAYAAQLRLALVQLRSQQLPLRERYESALRTADDVVIKKIDRDQPAAHTIRGYCHYGLGGDDNVSQSIRDFQKVLDDVPVDAEDHPWAEWRAYAEQALGAVKHWASLEEKTVTFPDTTLPRDWETAEGNGVSVKVEEGALRMAGETRGGDGSMDDPTVVLMNRDLYTRDSFEEITMELRIPPKKAGSAANNVTFGVQLSSGSSKSLKARTPGIGIYYDKGWIAIRVGGGQEKVFQDGDLHREGAVDAEDGVDLVKQEWPTDEWIGIRIVRLDADKGLVAVYMTTEAAGEELVFRDFVSGLKDSRGKASLFLVGWSSDREEFDVTVRNIVVVRRNR